MLGLTTQTRQPSYTEPTFDEMVDLARDFGLVADVRVASRSVHLCLIDEPLELSPEDAAILLKGLLLGYFHSQTRNDLSLASWIR